MTKIHQLISQIPESVLYNLIGAELYDALDNYLKIQDGNINVDYSEILLFKLGNKILLDSDVYKNIILFLGESDLKKLMLVFGLSEANFEKVRSYFIKKKFSYSNGKYSKKFIDTLGIDPKYYPQELEYQVTPNEYAKVKFPLHDYQKRIKDEAIKRLFDYQSSDKLMIHMPTGSGKTKTTMELISDYVRCKSIDGGFKKNLGIVWLAHTNELCQQASESFRMTWELRGDTAINVYDMYGDSKYSENLLEDERFIVFAGFQKFYALRKSNGALQNKILHKLISDIDLLIVDEAHKSLAQTYQESINILTSSKQNQKLIGLTATPGRSSEDYIENKILANFFHSEKITLQDEVGKDILEPIGYLQNRGILARLEREEIYTDIDIKLSEKKLEELKLYGDEKLSSIVNDLSKHPGRNQMIISRIEQSVLNNESLLVFGCNVNHCLLLEAVLRKKGIEAKSILSETPKTERAKIIDDFKSKKMNVLINYGVLTTGFDAPILNTVMITRPTSSIVLYSQMIGRALRGPKNGGNERNLLIDIKDNFEGESVQSMFTFFNEIWSIK